MATGRVNSRGGGIELDLTVEGIERTDAAFRQIRGRLLRDVSEIEADAAERAVLPVAKSRARGLKVAGETVAGTLVVRRRSSAPYLTTTLRGKKGRAVGLQEHGGTVRKVIRPKRGRKALRIGGDFVSEVRTARVYRGRKFMTGAVDDRLGEFGEIVRDEIVDRFFRPHFEIH